MRQQLSCAAHALQGVLPEVLAAAARILGGPVADEQPLMEAGLDSLGMCLEVELLCIS